MIAFVIYVGMLIIVMRQPIIELKPKSEEEIIEDLEQKKIEISSNSYEKSYVSPSSQKEE